jgi:hypothetical protein
MENQDQNPQVPLKKPIIINDLAAKKLKKSKNRKYYLGGLVFLLLIIGSIAAYVLTFINQDIRQQAYDDYSSGSWVGPNGIDPDFAAMMAANGYTAVMYWCPGGTAPGAACSENGTYLRPGDANCLGRTGGTCQVDSMDGTYQSTVEYNNNPTSPPDDPGDDPDPTNPPSDPTPTLPPGVTPTPPPNTPTPGGPMCHEIKMFKLEAGQVTDEITGSGDSDLEIGDQIRFVCYGTSDMTNNTYKFRMQTPGSNLYVDLPNTGSGATYMINQTGDHAAQCAVCDGSGNNCDWETL